MHHVTCKTAKPKFLRTVSWLDSLAVVRKPDSRSTIIYLQMHLFCFFCRQTSVVVGMLAYLTASELCTERMDFTVFSVDCLSSVFAHFLSTQLRSSFIRTASITLKTAAFSTSHSDRHSRSI